VTSSWFTEDEIFEVIAEEQSQKESKEIEFDDQSEVDYDLDYTVQY
jgi:hypothetical protein